MFKRGYDSRNYYSYLAGAFDVFKEFGILKDDFELNDYTKDFCDEFSPRFFYPEKIYDKYEYLSGQVNALKRIIKLNLVVKP